MGGGVVGYGNGPAFFSGTTEAIARHRAKHRLWRPCHAYACRFFPGAMVSASRLAEHTGKHGSPASAHSQRATLAYIPINPSIFPRPELELLFAVGRLEFGGAQKSMEFRRPSNHQFGRRHRRR